MAILVTGAAGFIGFHVCSELLARGEQVVGVDNLNDYYDVNLKHARLARLQANPDFSFLKADISEQETFAQVEQEFPSINRVVHLAAQAGVRHSLEAPRTYLKSNIDGQLNVLEYCRSKGNIRHLVYASSSSVYSGNDKIPFAESDSINQPLSLYGVTKHAGEQMAACYAGLYGIPTTGLRFFTVYGPFGRPDMAYYSFTRAMFAGEPITLYNNGQMQRDFTYIDDIVTGLLAALDSPPEGGQHRLLNLGNSSPETLEHFVAALEAAIGLPAQKNYAPLQPGDAIVTYADISLAKKVIGFAPQTKLRDGLQHFAKWYCEFYKLREKEPMS